MQRNAVIATLICALLGNSAVEATAIPKRDPEWMESSTVVTGPDGSAIFSSTTPAGTWTWNASGGGSPPVFMPAPAVAVPVQATGWENQKRDLLERVEDTEGDIQGSWQCFVRPAGNPLDCNQAIHAWSEAAQGPMVHLVAGECRAIPYASCVAYICALGDRDSEGVSVPLEFVIGRLNTPMKIQCGFRGMTGEWIDKDKRFVIGMHKRNVMAGGRVGAVELGATLKGRA